MYQIYNIMFPDQPLEEVKKHHNDATRESSLISDLIGHIEEASNNAGGNVSDPISLVVGMLTSGSFNNIIDRIKTEVETGQLDLNKLCKEANLLQQMQQ